MHALLKNLNPTTGIVTYWPTRGYRGSDRFTFSASDGQLSNSVATMNLTVIAPPDTNGNGLSDSWEAAYGVTDPNADDDGDEQSNLDEYFANTNPTNAASVLQITSGVRETNGHFGLTWSSVGGTRYRVQFGNDITSAGFTDIVRNLTNEMDSSNYGSPSTQSFTDDFTLTGAPTNNARYYRIKIVQ